MIEDLQKNHALTGAAKVAGVMGWPVAHSLSPLLHSYWLKQYNIDGAYIPLAVVPANIEQALRALPALGLVGCNLTVPHKELAVSIVDVLDPVARDIGAVNTITVSKEGKLHGYNTDWIGFLENVKNQAPGWQASGSIATVIGSGGAARAVLYALAQEGASTLRIINRTTERAQALATWIAPHVDHVEVYGFDRAAHALAEAETLINCTSLGMHGQPALEVDLSALPRQAIVADIVYNPLETDLLKNAKAKGHQVVDGLGMLLHQAVPGFEKWFGMLPMVTPDLRKYMLEAL